MHWEAEGTGREPSRVWRSAAQTSPLDLYTRLPSGLIATVPPPFSGVAPDPTGVSVVMSYRATLSWIMTSVSYSVVPSAVTTSQLASPAMGAEWPTSTRLPTSNT